MILGFEEKSGLEVQIWECRTLDDATQRENIDEEVEEVQGPSPEEGPKFGDQRVDE